MPPVLQQKIFRRLDFDTTYQIRVRVKWRGLVGEWSDPPLEHHTLSEDSIPQGLPPTLDFYKRDDHERHNKWTMKVIFPEMLLPNCKLDVDEYIVQVWRWNPKTNTLKDTQWERRKRVIAKDDEDNNNIVTVKFFPIPKKAWWVARYRAVVDGVKGPWSEFSGPGSASDNDPPPTPLNVTISDDARGVRTTWDVPSEFIVMAGTVSVVGSTVTGIGTRFINEAGEGSEIRVGNEIRTVATVFSDTSMTVDTPFSLSYSNVPYEADTTDDRVAFAQIQAATSPNFIKSSIVRFDRFQVIQHRRFKFDDSQIYYTRVRLVDSSGVKSRWVPATLLGNSNPDATPDGVSPGLAGGKKRIRFTARGRLRIAGDDDTADADIDEDSTLTRVRVVCKRAPTGANAIFKIWKKDNSDNLSLITTVTVDAGTKRKKVTGLSYSLSEDDMLTFTIEQVGSTYPGKTAVINCVLK